MFKLAMVAALGWRFGNHLADIADEFRILTVDMYRKYKRGKDSDLMKEKPLVWVRKRVDEALGTTSENKMKIGF